jgi:hypothetical protein
MNSHFSTPKSINNHLKSKNMGKEKKNEDPQLVIYIYFKNYLE